MRYLTCPIITATAIAGISWLIGRPIDGGDYYYILGISGASLGYWLDDKLESRKVVP